MPPDIPVNALRLARIEKLLTEFEQTGELSIESARQVFFGRDVPRLIKGFEDLDVAELADLLAFVLPEAQEASRKAWRARIALPCLSESDGAAIIDCLRRHNDKLPDLRKEIARRRELFFTELYVQLQESITERLLAKWNVPPHKRKDFRSSVISMTSVKAQEKAPKGYYESLQIETIEDVMRLMIAVAKNIVLERFRKRNRESELQGEAEWIKDFGWTEEEYRLVRDMAVEWVTEKCTIDAKDATILQMLFEGYTRTEIARKLGIVPGAITRRLQRIANRLRGQ